MKIIIYKKKEQPFSFRPKAVLQIHKNTHSGQQKQPEHEK